MALIEFKDLPDTSTPINAENLNYNFKELDYEMGGSDNKNWIKYSNGIMVQWGYISFPWISFSSSGAIYKSKMVTFELPQHFQASSKESIYLDLKSVSETGTYFNQSAYVKNDGYTVEGYFMRTDNVSSDIYCRYFAIGYWK